jgi:hypothetical protein
MADIDRKRLARYFKAFPLWAFVCLPVGIVLLAVDGLGIIVLGLCGFVIYRYFTARPTDQEVDRWLDEAKRGLQVKALAKLSLDESQVKGEILFLPAPRVQRTAGVDVRMVKGKDGILRYNPVHFLLLFPCQHQFATYQCCYDRLSGNALQEETDEIFYKDIVSVSTKTDDKTEKDVVNVFIRGMGNLHLTNSEEFVLTTSGGTSIEVFLSNEAIEKKAKGGKLSKSDAEKVVSCVRKMIREKKVEESASPQPQQAVPAASADDPIAKLGKLKSMLDAGLISQEDFDKKKAEILKM